MSEAGESMGSNLDWEEIVKRDKRGELGGGSDVFVPRLPLPKPDLKKWGLGGPGEYRLPPKNGDYTVVGLSDLHGKWREQGLFNAALKAIDWIQPDAVVFVGDEWDFQEISRWSTKQLSKMTHAQVHNVLKDEIEDVCTNIFAPVRRVVGNDVPMLCVEANHTDRLRNFLSDDLHEGWSMAREWLQVDEYLDGFYTRAGFYLFDEFLIRHGNITGQNPATKEYKDSQVSGWSGHLHKINQHFEPPWPNNGKQHVHTILPCMVRRDTDYGVGNAGLMRWHQGLGVLTMNASNHQDHWTDLGIYNGDSLLVRGRRFYS